jgi:putative ABC transport system permease protein
VVGDSRHSSLRETELQIYRPQYQQPWRYMRLLTHAAGDPLSRVEAVEAAVASVDPDLPATDPRTLVDVVDEFLLPQRGLSMMMGLLALGALVLSSVGIYGVIGQFVSRRTREIGIRMAIGATRGSVLSLILRRGLLLAGSGVLAGLVAAVAVARLLESFLFGVGALDVPSFVLTGAFLLGVAGLASALPARRAARVDPLEALRSE